MKMKSVSEVLKAALMRIDIDDKASLPEYIKYRQEMRDLFDDQSMMSSDTETG